MHRYLTDLNYGKSIISDNEFSSCNKVLEGKARSLREQGKGKRPNASQAVTSEDEKLLWEIGKLGSSSPKSLLHTMWFQNIQHFGQRGQQEHTTMTMENFTRNVDEVSGTPYIEFIEDPTKTRPSGLRANPRVTNPKMFATGGERCPVALFDLYVSKRPLLLKTSGRFYLTPKQSFSQDSWYTSSPVERNTIGKFMKEIISGTPLEKSGKKLTNHSGRKTLVKKVKQANIPEESIIKVTGHTSTKGCKIQEINKSSGKCQM